MASSTAPTAAGAAPAPEKPRKSKPHLAQPDVNPSFTKSIFRGELREDLVLPYPKLTAEEDEAQRMILDSFRSWAARHVDPRKHDHDGKFADGVREGMAELGLMGLNIPEDYGGFGAGAKVFRLGSFEAALGKKLAPGSLDGIAVAATDLNSDAEASAEYRAHLIGVMAKRAVQALA